jgi:predicted nuclease of restriction endonuclease-like (RecB) superfamily
LRCFWKFGLTALYWRIGSRILREVLGNERATFGEQIVATLSRQLSWSHLRELLLLERPHQREFYAEKCRIEGWSVRTLRERIDSMLYERTALSRQLDELVKQELAVLRTRGDMTPALLLKDPYILDFLGLTDRFLERDLEDAILRELETFLLELGSGFSFVARQKRIQLDGEDFYRTA